MKRLLLILMIFTLSIFVSAQSSSKSISEVLSHMVSSTDSYTDVFIVYGEDAAQEDMMGAFMISDIFPIIEEDEGLNPYIKKASEVTNPQNQNIILVGGPCANPLSEKITNLEGYNCNDWKFEPGDSIVKVFDNGGKKAILVAGTTLLDTWKMTGAIRRYKKSEKLSSSDEAVFETISEGKCGNDICETKETSENCPEDCSDEGSTQLTSGLKVKGFDIYQDKIAFYASSSYGSAPDIYLYDLTSNTQNKIGKGDSPKIYGDYIVFIGRQEVAGSESDWPTISLYNIPNGEEKILAPSEKFTYYWSPVIYENKVIWQKYRQIVSNDYGFYVYDIQTEETKLLEETETEQISLSFSGDYLAYELNNNVWLYDIANGNEKQLTSSEERQGLPDIDGNYIVWYDARSIAEGNKAFYIHNIKNGEQYPVDSPDLTIGPGASFASVNNNRITYSDYRNGNGDVYIYDLERKVERRTTFNSDNQGDSKLGSNHIVWIDHRNGKDKQDLFAYKLS